MLKWTTNEILKENIIWKNEKKKFILWNNQQ